MRNAVFITEYNSWPYLLERKLWTQILQGEVDWPTFILCGHKAKYWRKNLALDLDPETPHSEQI